MRQLCLCLFVELNTVKVSGSKTVGGVAKGVTVLINLVLIDMHTEGASSSLCLFPGKDLRFRLPATFCKIKVSGSKLVGGVTVLINLVWIDMHTERAFIWLGSICLCTA